MRELPRTSAQLAGASRHEGATIAPSFAFGSFAVRKFALILTASLAGLWTLQALADPPRHAPAHGWRKKHDPEYVGYTGTRWERDYDIREGRCNRDAIGAVLGGIAGAAIGSRIGDGDGRTVAIIAGTALGALIGSRIGRSIDDGDRACIGHALEVGTAGRNVVWQNAATGVNYVVVPGGGSKSGTSTCRNFTLIALADGKKSTQQGLACQSKPGMWQIAKP
jgi:surface antigen